MRTTIITAILAAAVVAVPAAAKAQDTTHKATSHRANPASHAKVTLASQAKISKDSASKVALAQVSGGTIKSSELEKEHGKLIYSFDITVPGQTGVEEVNVSAIDGSVVAHEHEDAAKEAAEHKRARRAMKGSRKTRNAHAAIPATPAPKP